MKSRVDGKIGSRKDSSIQKLSVSLWHIRVILLIKELTIDTLETS